MTSIEDKRSRVEVEDFLSGLSRHLQSRLPERAVIALQIANLMSGERSRVWERKPEGAESAFIGEYILPNVEEFLRERGTNGQGTGPAQPNPRRILGT